MRIKYEEKIKIISIIAGVIYFIVVAPGHRDSHDIKLYEVRYFVDAGYQVLGLLVQVMCWRGYARNH